MKGDIVELKRTVTLKRPNETRIFEKGCRFMVTGEYGFTFVVLDPWKKEFEFDMDLCRVLPPSPFVQFKFAEVKDDHKS